MGKRMDENILPYSVESLGEPSQCSVVTHYKDPSREVPFLFSKAVSSISPNGLHHECQSVASFGTSHTGPPVEGLRAALLLWAALRLQHHRGELTDGHVSLYATVRGHGGHNGVTLQIILIQTSRVSVRRNHQCKVNQLIPC